MKPRQPPRLDLRDVAGLTAAAEVRVGDGCASVEEGAVGSGERVEQRVGHEVAERRLGRAVVTTGGGRRARADGCGNDVAG